MFFLNIFIKVIINKCINITFFKKNLCKALIINIKITSYVFHFYNNMRELFFILLIKILLV